jgi:membrane associated rhomboid family serine protease
VIVFFVATGPRDPQSIWFAQGSVDAARIASGEIWRSATALTLHADWAHVVANATIGIFLLTVLGRSVGPGVAFALAVLAGTGGNIVNALLRSAPHISVGASTAVFGMVGILSGLSIVRRYERREEIRRVALPVAGAPAIALTFGLISSDFSWVYRLESAQPYVCTNLRASGVNPSRRSWPQAPSCGVGTSPCTRLDVI